MTTLLLLIMGAGGLGATLTAVLDPETARLLNSVVNLVTLAIIMYHRREVTHQVKPVLEETRAKVSHLDKTLGRRDPDPPVTDHNRRRTDRRDLDPPGTDLTFSRRRPTNRPQ